MGGGAEAAQRQASAVGGSGGPFGCITIAYDSLFYFAVSGSLHLTLFLKPDANLHLTQLKNTLDTTTLLGGGTCAAKPRTPAPTPLSMRPFRLSPRRRFGRSAPCTCGARGWAVCTSRPDYHQHRHQQ